MSNKKVWCWRSGPWWRGGLHAGGGFDKHGGRFGPCYFVSSLDLRRGLIPVIYKRGAQPAGKCGRVFVCSESSLILFLPSVLRLM